MKPQKRFRFLIIALTATIFLSACKSSENNNSVSTAAKKLSRQLLTVRTKNTILRAI